MIWHYIKKWIYAKLYYLLETHCLRSSKLSNSGLLLDSVHTFPWNSVWHIVFSQAEKLESPLRVFCCTGQVLIHSPNSGIVGFNRLGSSNIKHDLIIGQPRIWLISFRYSGYFPELKIVYTKPKFPRCTGARSKQIICGLYLILVLSLSSKWFIIIADVAA